MNYTLMPSLEHIALVKIATTLWTQSDIRALIARFRFSLFNREMSATLQVYDSSCDEMGERWQDVENKVKEMVPQLSQPEHFQKEMFVFIEVIGLQIFKWMDYYQNILGRDYVIKNFTKLLWTSQGTIDKKRTAIMLVQDANLDVVTRYKIACWYCLEDYIPILWNQLSGWEFYEKNLSIIRFNEPPLVSFWSHYVEREMGAYCRCSSITPYEHACQYSTTSGNKTATEFFFHKLTPMQKEKMLVMYTGYAAVRHRHYRSYSADLDKERYTDVVCFLLSQMNKEQQIKVFENYPSVVLECFLDWPWQRFFMKMANLMREYFSENDCSYLLNKIADKVVEGHKDHDYKQDFEKFWQLSLTTHKRSIIRECSTGFLLSKLFKIKDEKNIKLILNDATLIEKTKLIFSKRGQEIVQDLISDDNWHLLEFFIQECISSKDEMIEFRDFIKGCSVDEFVKNKSKYDKFFQLLSDFDCSYSKITSAEEGVSSPAKRLCSIELKEVMHSIKK